MSEDEAFLAAVRANSTDDTVRLVYADWLDERGDPRADFLRLDCHLRRLPTNDPDCQNHQQRLNELGRSLDRRWLTAVCRVQVDIGGTAMTSAAWDVPFSDWTVSAGGVSAIGGYREWNEDLLILDPATPIAIVLDGMGGEPGQRAAAVGGETLRRALADGSVADETTEDYIRRSLRTANDAVRGLGNEDRNFRNAGTTAVFAVLRAGRVYVSWAGGSMAYRLSLGRVEPLTWEHDFPNLLARHSDLGEDALSRFHKRLAHWLGGELYEPIEVQSFIPQAGDRLILTTDGVDGWPKPEFVSACRLHPDPLACADHLVRTALDAGSRDNATCVVIAFDHPPAATLR